MAQHGTVSHGRTWRIVVLFALVVSVVLASSGTWGSRPADAAQSVKATSAIAPAAFDEHGCNLGNFCAYSMTPFHGDKVVASHCGESVSIPFTGVGSWDNNLNTSLSATRVHMVLSDGTTVLTTASAHSELRHFDWFDIVKIVFPC